MLSMTLLLTLALLGCLFTVGSGLLLLLRRTSLAPGGSGMRVLWTFCLALAVIPIRILPTDGEVSVIRDENLHTVIVLASADAESALTQTDALPVPVTPPAPQPLLRVSAPAAMWLQIGTWLALGIWLGGSALRLYRHAREQRRTAAELLLYSVPCSDAEILTLYRQTAARLGLRRCPPLRIFEDGVTISPCCIGILSPTVCYSKSQLTLPPETLALLFTHELAHARARDGLLSAFSAAVLSLYWFFPHTNRAANAIVEACEIAADETVLRVCGADCRARYMHAILDIADAVRHCREASGSFGAIGARPYDTLLKRRYLSMTQRKHPRTGAFLACLLVAFLLCANVLAISSCAMPTSATAGEDPTPGVGEGISSSCAHTDTEILEAASMTHTLRCLDCEAELTEPHRARTRCEKEACNVCGKTLRAVNHRTECLPIGQDSQTPLHGYVCTVDWGGAPCGYVFENTVEPCIGEKCPLCG